jgi:thioredoxin 2
MDTIVVCGNCKKLNRVNVESKQEAICGNCKASLSVHEGVQDLKDDTLTTLVQKSSRPIVVDFWAPWCGPCKAFAPTFQQAAKTFGGKVVFAKLNTEAEPAGGARFHVRGIPTLIVFKNGVEVDRVSGALPLPELTQFLSRWQG